MAKGAGGKSPVILRESVNQYKGKKRGQAEFPAVENFGGGLTAY